jgi:hypothetical protein
MCTVTFLPYKEKVFITSNRDEKHWRSPAIPPDSYDFSTGRIFFPKDGDAGGTWFAVHENGHVVVLLNGAFRFHLSQPPYRKSRGVIVLELVQTASPFDSFRSVNLENIEPFTLVLWERDQLFECRWDGEKKHTIMLDRSIPHIWSSATLYDEKIAAERKAWFTAWLQGQSSFSQNDLFHFHRFAGRGDPANGLMMNRDGKVFTVSITGVEISPALARLQYFDAMQNDFYLREINLQKELVVKS